MKFSLALSFLAVVMVTVSAQPFDDGSCSLDTYYVSLPSDMETWDRTQLNQLIRTTHRNVPVFTNREKPGTNDVWQALMDLDAGSAQVENSQGGLVDSIHLVYQNIDIAAIPFGQRTWKKEHLWANSRGVGTNGTDYNDIHAIRPVDSDVDVVRDELWYGQCEVLEKEGACTTPAEGAASDTCKCNRVFMPPAEMRGEIARSLMYMDLRYDGTEPDTLNLRLTDCPFNAATDMGYLSQMITWNNEYPVTAAEMARNDMACANWQGNRNPFVDFPMELVKILYDPINPLPQDGQLIYDVCKEIPTSAPTFEPNECEMVDPGELYIFFMNSDNPDNLSIFVFVDLPEGLELYLTDDAWNGLEFQTDEGLHKVRRYCCCCHCIVVVVVIVIVVVDSIRLYYIISYPDMHLTLLVLQYTLYNTTVCCSRRWHLGWIYYWIWSRTGRYHWIE
jgi:endonuclease I